MNLIGRVAELAALERIVRESDCRLLTLTGPPGIGKTSLALAAVQQLRPAFAESVATVELASVADPSLVLTTIASALGIRDTGDGSAADKLSAAIGQRRMLLLLDNFEHLRSAAPAIGNLLESCPGVQALVTSRAPLHLDAEREHRVPPLHVPDQHAVVDLNALARVESVSLFLERARAARSTFQLTPVNASAVARVCVQLEGIPLAIELAAARLTVLAAEQVADRLDDCFHLLTNGRPIRPARHRTLEMALDWSFRLLEEPERAVLRRMAVFADGATADAVQHVCAANPADKSDVLDGMARLVDQSLVTIADHGDMPRYRLLEPVRQYALQRLRAAGEEADTRDRHAAFFLQTAEVAEPELVGQAQVVWLERLERELPNVRLAIDWYLERRAAEPALRLAAAVWKFCEVRGHAGEGERWLSSALALDSSDTVVRSKALHAASNLAFVRGDYVRSATLDNENLALRRTLGDTRGVGISLLHLAIVTRHQGGADRSLELCRDSLALFRDLDDAQWCANALNQLGMTLRDLRAYGAAREALEEALALFRRIGGTRRIANALGNLGDLAHAEGDQDRAETHLLQALECFHTLDDAWGTSAALESLALVACDRGLAQRAAVLLGAARALREEAGAALATVDLPAHQRAVATLHLGLGMEAFDAAYARGQQMPRPEAVMFARDRAAPTAPASITDREQAVAGLVASGASNEQIAVALVITRRTADTHVSNILRKLGLASRAQLAVWWVSRSTYL